MSDRTVVDWIRDPDGRPGVTWDPIVGCSPVSPGCINCYAMRQTHSHALRFNNAKYAGATRLVDGQPVWNGTVRLIASELEKPLRWEKPRRILLGNMSDLFHEDLPYEAIDRILGIVDLAQHHTFLVLTKRADRAKAYLSALHAGLRPLKPGHPGLPNLWIGTSIESRASKGRLEALQAIPAALRFVCFEPLLEHPGLMALEGISWIIARGEAGPAARPAHPAWIRSLRHQARAATIPFWFAGWGEWQPTATLNPKNSQPTSEVGKTESLRKTLVLTRDGQTIAPAPPLTNLVPFTLQDEPVLMERVGKKSAGTLLDGETIEESPPGPPPRPGVRSFPRPPRWTYREPPLPNVGAAP